MVKIVGEAKAEREEETDAQRRRKIFGRIRVAIRLLMLATILGFVYCWRAELQFLFF